MIPKLEELRRTPRRIVCVAPSNTEILYALGAEDRIVGVSRFCDYPPQAKDKPRCGGFLDPGIESILALKPDLVLAQSFLQEDAVKAFAHHEVRVLCFSCTSLTELLEDILLLGRLVERESAADKLVSRMHDDLVRLGEQGRALASRAGRKPRVHLEEWGPKEPYYIAGDWAAEMLGLAGAENAFSDRNLRCPSPERTCTAEEIAARDPDIIMAAWCGCAEKVDLDRVRQRPALAGSRGIREDWLRVIDDRFVMRPGPRIIEGVRRMQAVLEEWTRGRQ
jgi:ABC-type Fe3+-hydroxamate transport system substrate-binding protein